MSSIMEHGIIKDWVSTQKSILRNIFPHIKDKEITNYLERQINMRLVNVDVKIHNNYAGVAKDIGLLEVVDWIRDKKPICAGFGMFFKNQEISTNPNAQMILNFLDLRKVFKDQLKIFSKGTYDYNTANRKQSTEKINANSFYGCNGAAVSRFFNIYTASSVTLSGQSLISTTAQAFESFLSNNVLFYDLDNCFEFLEKVKGEDYSTKIKNMPNVTLEAVFDKLVKTFYNFKDDYEAPLFAYLINSKQELLNKLYYKNNLYEFSKLPYIKDTLMEISADTEEFLNPNVIPSKVEGRIKGLWDIYSDWVFYNHSPIGRIDRLKTHTRKSVVTVDTDSNMINLDPWVEFMFNDIFTQNEEFNGRDYDNLRFVAINTMCTFLTAMINSVLAKYTKLSNVPKKERRRINMKNEYLFTKMMTTSSKKRYIASIRLKEGEEVYPEEVDIKGLDFMKATTREDTMKRFKSIIQERIIDHETVDLMGTLDDLDNFETHIRESLTSGGKSFLNPANVKEPEAYADPMKMPQLRAVLAWNAAYPTKQIGLPENVDLVKLRIKSREDLERLEQLDPDVYEGIMKEIYNSPIDKIREKGLSIIAIPRNEDVIPAWILEYIDYDGIINKNLTQFKAVLESMGIVTIEMDNMTFYTNIKKIG